MVQDTLQNLVCYLPLNFMIYIVADARLVM